MTTPAPSDPQEKDATDVTRRTWLAAERTWLAWWRTGVGVAALAIAVGRLLPGATAGAHWPFRLVGLGYGVLAVAVLVLGAMRQQRTARALRSGGYDELGTGLVMWLTAVAVALSVGTLAIVLVDL
jgi:putative membrane protein